MTKEMSMSIANWCVVAACVLPVLTVGMAKASFGLKSSVNKSGYDNRNPRQWESGLSGWQHRAVAAQANGFEALPLFIAAIVLAQQAHADQARIDLLAMTFIGIRLAYVAAYLMNQAALRSLIWFTGLGVSIAILAMAG
jgi:uncharacterized MAPEG superfamily protein